MKHPTKTFCLQQKVKQYAYAMLVYTYLLHESFLSYLSFIVRNINMLRDFQMNKLQVPQKFESSEGNIINS